MIWVRKLFWCFIIGPESDHWLCLSVTNWLPNWLTDSCLVVPLAMFKRLLWLQSRITWLLRVLGKYYFADLHRIHVRLQCIYCAVKSFLSFLVSPSTAQWTWTRSHLKRVFTCVLATVCCRFGSWGLVIKLNFCSDSEHKVCSRCWCLVEI